jgi:hypothetical protein
LALALPSLGAIDPGWALATLARAALAAGLLAWDASRDEEASPRPFLLALGGLLVLG